MSVEAELPRLAIIGDIFVERTAGGALLLYRLLQQYPPERLLVVGNTASRRRGDPTKRLPGVRHVGVPCSVPLTIRNRLLPAWPVVLPRVLKEPTARCVEGVRDFDPEAVLTSAYDFLWLSAAGVARKLGVPLHLILHDDWASTITDNRGGRIGHWKRRFARRVMGPVYRQAASRLCVSPGMAEHYQAWFGVGGRLLYPSRGEDSPEPRVRVRPVGGPPVVAYCGLVCQAGTADLLGLVAATLARLGGHLDLYTPHDQAQLDGMGLGRPNVRLVGFLPPREMAGRLAATAHALFLPASFEPRERDDVATLFPSKLADYTAIGLPVLIWGPVYSSAARWAAENSGAAVLITDRDPDGLEEPIARLASDPAYAKTVAGAGTRAGSRDFDLETARETLYRAIMLPRESPTAVATGI